MVAHPDAADVFDQGVDTCLLECILDRFVELAASACDTAGVQADSNLGLHIRRRCGHMGLLCTDGFLVPEEIGEHQADAVCGQVAIDNVADLHGRRQRAAA